MKLPIFQVNAFASRAFSGYWAKRLGKPRLRARQLSPRGATIECEHHGDRVWLRCQAVKYLQGEIHL